MAKTKTESPREQSSYLSVHPQYIVVFRKPSEKNVSLMSKTLKVGQARGVSARSGCDILAAKAGAMTRVYSRLGVAVADLSDDERNQLAKDDAVEDIYSNEERVIPPYRIVTEIASETSAMTNTSEMIAYLRGMHQAISMVLAAHGAPVSSSGKDVAWMPSFTGSSSSSDWSWCLDQIRISAGTTHLTGKKVQAAVLDTGIDLAHPDFTGRFQEEVNAKSFVAGEPVHDGHGHGTHCAGVVAGPPRPAGGRRYGVAPDTDLLVGKVLNNEGRGIDDSILDGMDWAADQGARVISMSLGSLRKLGAPFSPAYERVAANLLSQGVLIVAAAGNSSLRPTSVSPVENPAACPSILAVGAVDQHRQVSNFSCAELDNIGTLDVCAPGVAVYSSWTGGGYRSISGTSMATPHVAGLACLFLEQQPTSTGKTLWDVMLKKVVPLGSRADYGHGLIQAP